MGVSLGYLQDLFDVPVTKSELDLQTAMSAIKSGKDVDAAQLLYYTNLVNQNSLMISMVSSMVKERGDVLKGCCQKF
ncbi:hypothetical protein GCM10023165_34050 [Variovorax defluvii]|uniref:Uncharacterized protein n=1 Tax=Variovorax defluvii TaxID=913761 RepID=A0ABP8HZP1_9BURK